MATMTTSYPGNLALEQHIWTLTLPEAKAMLPLLDTHTGSYWHENAMKPYLRAVRAKALTVRIYTAGFTTGEFSNVLYASGGTITEAA